MPTSQAQSRSVTLQKGPSHSPLLPTSSSRNISRPTVRNVMPAMIQPTQPTSPLQQPQSSLPPLQQQSSHSQDREPVSSEAYNFSGRKRTRGKSRGKVVHNMIEANDGKKVPVEFDLVLEVPDNIKVSSNLSSEIGNIVRIHASVRHDGLKNVPQKIKGFCMRKYRMR